MVVVRLEQEIRSVVRSLCQGTADEQWRTIDRYFTKDASFIHPFCIVPHFHERRVPLLGSLSSRDVVRSIFQWYRMLSPRIDIEIDSACTYLILSFFIFFFFFFLSRSSSFCYRSFHPETTAELGEG